MIKEQVRQLMNRHQFLLLPSEQKMFFIIHGDFSSKAKAFK